MYFAQLGLQACTAAAGLSLLWAATSEFVFQFDTGRDE